MDQNKEIHILPNGEIITYTPDDHKYYISDRLVPSVTQLLDIRYGNSYTNVKPEVLKIASEYGTKVHNELNEFILKRLDNPATPLTTSLREVYNYFTKIEQIYKVKPILTEKVVALYDQNNEVQACGRFDLLCEAMGKKYLVDFKTTSSINRTHVTGQLNLYLQAAFQSGYINSIEDMNLGVIHLSGETAKMVPITKLNSDYYLTFFKN